MPLSDYAHNPPFQELSTVSQYFTKMDEKIFIDSRRGKGYTNELKKISRDDSDLSISIKLKAVKMKKNEIASDWTLSRQIFILAF